MAKLSFPTSPSVNDIYTQDGISYQWDGSKWTANNDTALNLDAILANGSSTTKTLTTGAITSPTAAKAWVNFNGVGTVVINDSFNVSSVTDNGVGDFTVNFTNALSNTNYAVTGGVESINATPSGVITYGTNGTSRTTTSVRIATAYLDTSVVPVDEYHTCVVIFSN